LFSTCFTCGEAPVSLSVPMPPFYGECLYLSPFLECCISPPPYFRPAQILLDIKMHHHFLPPHQLSSLFPPLSSALDKDRYPPFCRDPPPWTKKIPPTNSLVSPSSNLFPSHVALGLPLTSACRPASWNITPLPLAFSLCSV